MNDNVKCPHCGEVTHIGGLIGEHTNDCPRCGSNVWDWASIGISEAKQCTDCGELYIENREELVMGQRTTFNIQYKGIWLDVDVKRGQSILDGRHWVYTQEVRHADEDITPLLSALEFSQIDHIIEKELDSK